MQPQAANSTRITPVTTDTDYEKFVALAAEVYPAAPAWVRANSGMEAAEVRGRTPFGAHCRLQPFIAESGGRVVARVLALVDDEFNRHWRQRAGHLALFEALSDEEASVIAMMDAACAWLQEQGCTFARQGFMFGWAMPFTIDAYG